MLSEQEKHECSKSYEVNTSEKLYNVVSWVACTVCCSTVSHWICFILSEKLILDDVSVLQFWVLRFSLREKKKSRVTGKKRAVL